MLHFLVFSKGEIAIILKCVSWLVDIAHVNSSKKKKTQNPNEWKLVEELPAAGFIMDRGSDMISHAFKTSVTSLTSMELLLICKGVNEAKIRQRPRETLWERVLVWEMCFTYV